MKQLEAVMLLSDLCLVIEQAKHDPAILTNSRTKDLVRRSKKWATDAATDPESKPALPSWVRLTECRYCGADIFFAKNEAKAVPLCPQPLHIPDEVITADCVYVNFSQAKAVIIPGKLGTRWLVHQSICGKSRPEAPVVSAIWDATYGSAIEKRGDAVEHLLGALDDLA